MGVWKAIEMLGTLVDESDPDTSLGQIEHLLQTAEAIRRDGKPEWMQVREALRFLSLPFSFQNPFSFDLSFEPASTTLKNNNRSRCTFCWTSECPQTGLTKDPNRRWLECEYVGRGADCEGEEGWLIRSHVVSMTEILGIFLFSSLLALALKLCEVFSSYLILVNS